MMDVNFLRDDYRPNYALWTKEDKLIDFSSSPSQIRAWKDWAIGAKNRWFKVYESVKDLSSSDINSINSNFASFLTEFERVK